MKMSLLRNGSVRFLIAAGVLTIICLLILPACAGSEADYEAGSFPAVAMSPKESYRDASMADELSAPAPEGAAVNTAPPLEKERARIYSASLSLEVTRVETVRNSLGERALELGGRIEGISSEGIVVLVPAEYFFPYLDEAEALGVLIDRNVSALDVSEALAETETRLKIAREARQRLYDLLEESREGEERLAILREIRRLSEKIETMELQLATMKERIAFSRVSCQLVTKMGSRYDSRGLIPFRWMRNLDPFGVSLGSLEGAAIDPGGSFAVFRDPPSGNAFYAESADGAVLRMASTANEPEGDAAFWQEAMLNYLAPLYSRVEVLELPLNDGNEKTLKGVICSVSGEPGYRYEVVAVPEKGGLMIVEGVFPGTSGSDLIDSFHEALKERF